MYPNFDYSKGYAWGMAIDQNVCTGCNACVVACQAENNVPVVGKAQVLERPRDALAARGSLLHRRARQPRHVSPADAVSAVRERAVRSGLPGGRDVHNDEGLNDMVYNRCVGTRYCSNNCPYKVRRFNFLLYEDFNTPSLKLMRNPDVTVRSRGVMEKCTYCVQRINQARVAAKLEDREIRDGEVVTACQAACPTDAIVFGNINDPNSQVSQRKASPLNYGAARRAQHAAADHVPGDRAEPEHGARTRRHRRRRRGRTLGMDAPGLIDTELVGRRRGAARAHAGRSSRRGTRSTPSPTRSATSC